MSVGPAGVEPASHRVSDGYLTARSRPEDQRPVRELNPSGPVDGRIATPAASQSERVSGGSRTRLVHRGGVVPQLLGHGHTVGQAFQPDEAASGWKA